MRHLAWSLGVVLALAAPSLARASDLPPPPPPPPEGTTVPDAPPGQVLPPPPPPPEGVTVPEPPPHPPVTQPETVREPAKPPVEGEKVTPKTPPKTSKRPRTYPPVALPPELADFTAPAERAPLKPLGIGISIVSAISIGAGIVARAVSPDTVRVFCYDDLSFDCIERTSDGDTYGMMAIGAGVGFALIGAPLWLQGIKSDGKPGAKERSAGRMQFGIVTTALGSALAGIGITASYYGGEYESPVMTAAAPCIFLSTVLLGIGIPLWATGARSTKPVDQTTSRHAPPPLDVSVRVGPTSAELVVRF